jgi:hypothetical protein
VLLPYNYSLLQLHDYRADVDRLLEVCTERGVAVQTIKALARGRWPEDFEGPRFSWYDPVTDPHAIGRATRFVLEQPGLFLNTSSDARLLATTLEAATDGPAPTTAELEADQVAHGIRPLFDGVDLERI